MNNTYVKIEITLDQAIYRGLVEEARQRGISAQDRARECISELIPPIKHRNSITKAVIRSPMPISRYELRKRKARDANELFEEALIRLAIREWHEQYKVKVLDNAHP